MFENWATLYDALYAKKGKRYDREVAYLEERISENKTSEGNRLLDVACGTGEHLQHFQQRFRVGGLDRSYAMIEVARRKLPDVPFWQVDMTTFDLDQQWRPVDVVTCLFSSIGYLDSVRDLHRSIARMAAHLAPGGILLLEPAVLPDRLQPPEDSSLQIQVEDQIVERETGARLEDRVLRISFRYRVTAAQGPPRTFAEEHAIFLFTQGEYESALAEAGLSCTFDPVGPSGLGLFVGKRGVRSGGAD